MPLIALQATVERPRGLGRVWARIQKEALLAVAEDFRQTLLPRRFTAGNRQRYRIEPRNKVYLEKIKPLSGKGQGRFVDLLLRGQSARWMRLLSSAKGTAKRVTVSMPAPTYFTKPFIGTFQRDGKLRRVSRQPDKPRETTTISSEDRLRFSRQLDAAIRKGIREFRGAK